MATMIDRPHGIAGEHRFFLVATWLLAILTVSGFALNLALGRSTFAVPLPFHIHAAVFMSFIGLYTAQVTLAARGNLGLHKKLGLLAALFIPAMWVLAIWITLVGLRVIGGPPFFKQSEFLAVNILHITTFAGLAIAALRMRNRPDWHKRLMFGAVVTVSLPGVARLLPLPFLIPWTFPFTFAVISLFPLAGMVMDKRLNGHVHPAWKWVFFVPWFALLIGEAIGATPFAENWVAAHVAGFPGAERPPEAFLPPGM